MSQELFYTSAPNGLRPGSRGFCTVMSTSGMAKNLADRMEALSGYRHVFAANDPQAAFNPVNYSHLKINVGGVLYHVLSRISAAGLDYTQRSNKFAHHVVLDGKELVPAGPAAVLAAPGFMESTWEGEPRVIGLGRKPPAVDAPPAVCKTWAKLTGDAGWGGVLAETALGGPSKVATVIFEPGMDTLALVAESLALLPKELRWQVTFSTYYTKLPPEVQCQWRFVLKGSPEAKAAERGGQSCTIDLSNEHQAPTTSGAQAGRQGAPLSSKSIPVRTDTPSLVGTQSVVISGNQPTADLEPVIRDVDGPPLVPVYLHGSTTRTDRRHTYLITGSTLVLVALAILLGVFSFRTIQETVTDRTRDPLAPATKMEAKGTPVAASGTAAGDEVERDAKAEAERKAKDQAEREAKAEAERKAQEEADRKRVEERRVLALRDASLPFIDVESAPNPSIAGDIPVTAAGFKLDKAEYSVALLGGRTILGKGRELVLSNNTSKDVGAIAFKDGGVINVHVKDLRVPGRNLGVAFAKLTRAGNVLNFAKTPNSKVELIHELSNCVLMLSDGSADRYVALREPNDALGPVRLTFDEPTVVASISIKNWPKWKLMLDIPYEAEQSANAIGYDVEGGQTDRISILPRLPDWPSFSLELDPARRQVTLKYDWAMLMSLQGTRRLQQAVSQNENASKSLADKLASLDRSKMDPKKTDSDKLAIDEEKKKVVMEQERLMKQHQVLAAVRDRGIEGMEVPFTVLMEVEAVPVVIARCGN